MHCPYLYLQTEIVHPSQIPSTVEMQKFHSLGVIRAWAWEMKKRALSYFTSFIRRPTSLIKIFFTISLLTPWQGLIDLYLLPLHSARNEWGGPACFHTSPRVNVPKPFSWEQKMAQKIDGISKPKHSILVTQINFSDPDVSVLELYKYKLLQPR